MNSNRTLLISAVFIGCVIVVLTSIRVQSARSRFESESIRFTQLSNDIATLERLRAAEDQAQGGEPPEDDLLGTVRSSIREAGLNSAVFAGLSTNGDEPVRGRDGYRKKSYRLELSEMDATDLGSFLSVWRETEPLWTVEGIELRRQQSGRRSRVTTGYSVSITMATVYAKGIGNSGENQR